MDSFLTLTTCQFLWYIVFLFAMFAYAALDGFDIGVGLLHPFVKTDHERRIFLNSIGPVWDGNSLWVIICAGGMMAGFPVAFSVLFSALYIPMYLLVFGYIYRGVAIEFRSKRPSARWRSTWDFVFSGASYMLALGFGITLANLISGLPLNKEEYISQGLSFLFSPYALLMGIFTVSLFMLHGGLYLHMKTQGALQLKIRHWLNRIYAFFLFMWILTNAQTVILRPYVLSNVLSEPIFSALQILGVFCLVLLPLLFNKGKEGAAFLSSIGVIASLIVSYGLGTYPNIIRSTIAPLENSITIYNGSASLLTMKILLLIAAIGAPLFICYLVYTYKVFRGKVEIDQMSY